jgi:hypothetical protein
MLFPLSLFHLTHHVGNEIGSYELRGGSRVQAELKRQIVFHDCSPALGELSNGRIVRGAIPIVAMGEIISELSIVYLCSAT